MAKARGACFPKHSAGVWSTLQRLGTLSAVQPQRLLICNCAWHHSKAASQSLISPWAVPACGMAWL